MNTMEQQEELIGEDLYGTLLAEGVTSDSFTKIAERISSAKTQGKADGEERLQKYTEAYLKEGIKRCDAALRQGRAEGAEQMREALRTRGQYTQRGDTVLSDYITPMAATRAAVDMFIIPASVLAPPVQTEKEQEIQFLRHDIDALEGLLADLPTDRVIERLGFESKKQEDKERLAVLAPKEEK